MPAQGAPEEGERALSVLVVDDAPDVRRSVCELLELDGLRVVGEAADGREAVRLACELRPDAVIMDINLPGLDGLSATEQIVARCPSRVILLSVEDGAEYYRRAMTSGASDYLVKPYDGDNLTQAVRRACRLAESPPEADLMPGAGPAVRGRVLAVFGAKGGVGASTLAVNLAVGLARLQPQEPIVVLDGDLEFGSVAALAGLRPRADLADLCRTRGAITADVIRKVAARPVGLPFYVLPAPQDPVRAAEVDGDGRLDPQRNYLAEILQRLRELFATVIVDTSPGFREPTLLALEEAEHRLVVSTPDLPTLDATSRALHVLLDQLGYPAGTLSVVLNRRDEGTGLAAREAQAILDCAVACEVPYDRTAHEAAQSGQPMLARRRLSPAAEAIQQLAAQLAPAVRAPAAPGGQGATGATGSTRAAQVAGATGDSAATVASGAAHVAGERGV